MFKCFKKNKEIDVSKTPKIVWGIIIPHTVIKQGASTKADHREFLEGYSEYNYASDMVKTMHHDTIYAFRDSGGVKGASIRLRDMGCNASLEPHLNAFNTKAEGYEILCLKEDKLSQYYAEMFIESFRLTYPKRKMRHGNGIKLIGRGDRGYNNLKTARKYMEVALLSEMFFIDNPSEWVNPATMGGYWDKNIYLS